MNLSTLQRWALCGVAMATVALAQNTTGQDTTGQHTTGQHTTGQDATATSRTAEQILPLVQSYCGACHAVPRPDVLPRRAWPATVRVMVEIMQARTGRAHLTETQMNDLIAFYYGNAPEELPPLPYDATWPAERGFVARAIGAGSPLPFVTHLDAVRLTGAKGVELLACDGETRRLLLLGQRRGQWRETALAEADVPVHTQVIDFDGDRDADVLLADLGQFPPLDAPVGKVWLLRQVAPGRFERELLQERLGRVSDARAVDLDGDGDLDIAVAVFGGGDKGEVFWLEQGGDATAPGGWRKHALFDLSGAITVAPADLDGDGRMDLLSLVAQEHEMILAFLNQGDGRFERATLARGPHPMYGSTSLTPVDLDRDGDVDVLFTNGDAFDAQTDPKPYHGVQWLENRGGLRFEYHAIGRFYGAATAAAGDLDGDGDLDVVAGSWVNHWTDAARHAVVWYENDGRQNFTAHGLATRPAGVASLQLADVTGDGAPDIVVGAIRMDLLLTRMGASYRASRWFPPAQPGEKLPRVVVLENPGFAVLRGEARPKSGRPRQSLATGAH